MGTPGYQVAAEDLGAFASTLNTDGGRYIELTAHVPKFGAADYLPGWGVPLLGTFFIGDYNATSDLVSDALAALGKALQNSGDSLLVAARTYLENEKKVLAGLPKTP